MNFRIKNCHGVVPPGGWQYQEEGWSAPAPLATSFRDQIVNISNFRRQNPRFGLSSNLADCESALHNFTAARLNYHINWCEAFDEDSKKNSPTPPTPSPKDTKGVLHAAIDRLWSRFKNDAKGAALLARWIGEGALPVEPSVAAARANACLKGNGGNPCPHNQPGKLLESSIADEIRNQTAVRKGLNLTVPGEVGLRTCGLCGCHLPLKVWVPDVPPLANAPDYCWQKKPDKIFIQLGRAGDIINVLPIMWAENQSGKRPSLLVAREYAGILDGVSYCDCVVWDGDFTDLAGAEQWARERYGDVSTLQIYGRNLAWQIKTDSFAKDAWYRAGRLSEWGLLPLIFDRRDAERERVLRLSVNGRFPLVLVAVSGFSSPFPHSDRLLKSLSFIQGIQVINLTTVRAHRLYDLLGLMDVARVLVTVDTAHVHLAPASKVKVISLVTDTPSAWHGAPERKGQIFRCRYSEYLNREADLLSAVRQACFGKATIRREFALPDANAKIRHLYQVFPATGNTLRRQKFAEGTWPSNWIPIPFYEKDATRSARSELGDPRNLPFIKDVIDHACKWSSDGDVLVFTNSDTCIMPGASEKIISAVRERGSAFSHRWDFKTLTAPLTGIGQLHSGNWYCGSDGFYFTPSWWRAHRDLYPDMIMGAEWWDCLMRQLIKMAGGTEVKDILYHEQHDSEWCRDGIRHKAPSAIHVNKLADEWFSKWGTDDEDWKWFAT